MPPQAVPNRHQGKVAIVTGAGQGIGRGVAHRLAQEGAQVVVAEYNQANAEKVADELASYGSQSVAYPIDISDTDQIDRMASSVAEHFGHIDILVNNAGVHEGGPMLEVTPASWDRIQNVNVRGAFFAMQAVARVMVARIPEAVKQAGSSLVSCGKIVNFLSIAGRAARPNAAAYAASKWGVISITESAALSLAPYNINVNAVCPGIVVTPLWEKIDQTQTAQFVG